MPPASIYLETVGSSPARETCLYILRRVVS